MRLREIAILWAGLAAGCGHNTEIIYSAKPYQEPVTAIRFPSRLGDLEKYSVTEHFSRSAGVGIRYTGPDSIRADILVFPGPYDSIPAGMESPEFQKEYSSSREEILWMGRMETYRELIQVRDTVITLGPEAAPLAVRLDCFEYVYGRATPTRSYLVFGAFRGRFFKIRFTTPTRAAGGDQRFANFLAGLGRCLPEK